MLDDLYDALDCRPQSATKKKAMRRFFRVLKLIGILCAVVLAIGVGSLVLPIGWAIFAPNELDPSKLPLCASRSIFPLYCIEAIAEDEQGATLEFFEKYLGSKEPDDAKVVFYSEWGWGDLTFVEVIESPNTSNWQKETTIWGKRFEPKPLDSSTEMYCQKETYNLNEVPKSLKRLCDVFDQQTPVPHVRHEQHDHQGKMEFIVDVYVIGNHIYMEANTF
jgi:hypothetical protein